MRLAPLLSAAEDGIGFAAEILMEAVLRQGRVNYRRLRRLLKGFALASDESAVDVNHHEPSVAATSATEFANSTIETVGHGDDFILPPYINEHHALKLISSSDLNMTGKTPTEILDGIFEGIEYARAQRSENKPFSILQLVSRGLAEKAGLVILGGLNESGVKLPPPPHSEKYDQLLTKIVGFKPEVLDAWKSWDYWRISLAYQFAGILYDPEETKPSHDLIERIEHATELKRIWYTSLAEFGVEDADIEKAVKKYHRNGGFNDLRALAELRRFVKPDDEELMQNPHSAALLASAIIALHAQDYSLGEDKFLKLLPHYAYPMTIESVARMLKDDNPLVTLYMRRKAEASLIWHADTSDEKIEFMASRVRLGGFHYTDPDKFSRDTFGVPASDLREKVLNMAREGFFAEPLAFDIMEAFPGRIEFDLDAMRSAAKSTDDETKFGGITRSAKAAADDDVEDDEEAAAEESAEAAAEQTMKGAEQLTLGLSVLGTSGKIKV